MSGICDADSKPFLCLDILHGLVSFGIVLLPPLPGDEIRDGIRRLLLLFLG